MKAASAAVLATLASGQYLRFDFYKMVLPTIGTVFFHTADTGGPIVIATPASVAGTYLPGLTIIRSAFTQKLGFEVQSCNLTIAPQSDNPGGAVTLGGGAFMSQVVAGVFDGAIITVSKGIFPLPVAGGPQLDTSGGIVPFFVGVVSELQAGRFSVDITVNDVIQLLNLQMPRNILSAGCVHTVFDAGCTLLKSSFTTTGSVATVSGANSITSALAQADGYFDRGILKFTSGVLSGGSYVVSKHLNAAGSVQTIVPFPRAPSPGDTFSVIPGCDKSQATCTTKFSNLAHYRGAPFVPVPQTLYDGGTTSTAAPTLGGQGGQGAGSSFGGGLGAGTYAP